MSLSSNASYLSTLDEFIPHWTAANAALGASGPMILAGSLDVEALTDMRDALEVQRATIEGLRNDLEGARADIEIAKTALLERLNQFNSALVSLAPDSRWTRMRPKAFSVSEGMGRVVPPLDDVEHLWGDFETDGPAGPPLVLAGNHTRAMFAAALAGLKAAYTAQRHAGSALGLARAARDEMQQAIRAALNAYRSGIAARFAEGTPVFETLPRLSPLPGSTPDAVTATGSLDAGTGEITVGWSAVTDASVTQVQVRASAGPDYEDEDATVVATRAPADPPEWTGTFGGGTPGSSVSLKVYVMTATGNERGSNTVTVTVPVP